MKSWVRYSVAVYVGLMIAGALGMQKPQVSEATSTPPIGAASPYPHEMFPSTWRRRAIELREESRIGIHFDERKLGH